MNPNENSVDIANEIRGYFDLLKRGMIPDNVARMTTRQRHQFWADRIEAAAKREQTDLADAHDAIARLDLELAEVRRERDSCAAENSLLARSPGSAAAKWLYRLEYHDGTCGLWYDGSGNWCFERGIGSLDDSCKTKSLPMGYDERYRQDGRSWFSSCSRKEDLLHWYSREDAKRLLSHGFVFTRYLATEYREYDQQTVFIKETCLYREEIDFESLWKSSSPGNVAAMRAALLRTINILRYRVGPDELQEIVDAARAALDAPARNCDTAYADIEEARRAFKRYCQSHANCDECAMSGTDAFKNGVLCFFAWLLAPADAEAKGETK